MNEEWQIPCMSAGWECSNDVYSKHDSIILIDVFDLIFPLVPLFHLLPNYYESFMDISVRLTVNV